RAIKAPFELGLGCGQSGPQPPPLDRSAVEPSPPRNARRTTSGAPLPSTMSVTRTIPKLTCCSSSRWGKSVGSESAAASASDPRDDGCQDPRESDHVCDLVGPVRDDDRDPELDGALLGRTDQARPEEPARDPDGGADHDRANEQDHALPGPESHLHRAYGESEEHEAGSVV